MPRSQVVTVNGKTITVAEKRIGELETLASRLGISVESLLKLELKALLPALLYEKLPELFPELTADDVKNAYPSEIEALMEAFFTVNGAGLKRLAAPLWSIFQPALMRFLSAPSSAPAGASPKSGS